MSRATRRRHEATSPPASTNEVVVSNLGQASLDLLQIADRPLNCYTFGAMGQCSSIGLGIAIGRPDIRVVCLDGDGSLIMNLGSLCTIAAEAPKNYVLMVWDNEVHQTTGGQPTATAPQRAWSAWRAAPASRRASSCTTRRSWSARWTACSTRTAPSSWW